MSLKNLVTGSDDGLTSKGISEAVNRHCEFDAALPGPRVRSKKALENIVERLQIRGKATTDDLLVYFPEDDIHVPDQGRYGEHSGEQWFKQVIEPNLKALPGVKHKRGKWAFSGVSSSKYDDKHTRPVSEIRDDPQLQAKQALDDLGFPRGEDKRDFLLAFYDELREQGTTTTDELDRMTHRITVEELEDTFIELPGVERKTIGPAEPADIEIETYADVLEAEEKLSGEPTVEWHYSD